MSDMCPSAGADSRFQEARRCRLLRRARVGCLSILLAAGVAAPAAAVAADAPGSTPKRVVVVFESGVPASQRAAVRAAADTRAVRVLGRERFQLLAPKPGQSVDDAVEALRGNPGVAAADPDISLQPQSIPNDPLFGQLWGLRNLGQNAGGVAGADIDATFAWDRTVGDPSVVVADIDSGYFFEHPDLGAVAWTNPGETPGDGIDDDDNGYVDDWRGWDHHAGDNDPTDDYDGHGVHTAGIIGAKGNDGFGVSGVAQNARIMPLRICGPKEFPPFGVFLDCPTSALIEAMNYAGQNGARAANMSLTGYYRSAVLSETLAANPGVLFVAAAGNDGLDAGGTEPPPMPCSNDPSAPDPAVDYEPPAGAIDNVVCVAATDPADALASFSNYGARSVDLAAPGTETLSTKFESEVVFQPSFDSGEFTDWTTPSPPASDATQGWAVRGGSFLWSDLINPQDPGTTRATQSPPVSVAEDFSSCIFTHKSSTVVEGDDSYHWAIYVDGVQEVERTAGESLPGTTVSDSLVLPASDSPHTVTARFWFHRGLAGADPAVANVGEIKLECYRPVHKLEQGTSMAAPHVTGAAALLFSLKPSASVSQVRNVLLGSVDGVPSLAGKTATGGRLNAWKALAALVPMDTRITGGPTGNAKSNTATFTFDTNNTGNAGFECRLDSGPFQPCTSPKTYNGLPKKDHSFRVRSAVQGGVDGTPAIRDWKSK